MEEAERRWSRWRSRPSEPVAGGSVEEAGGVGRAASEPVEEADRCRSRCGVVHRSLRQASAGADGGGQRVEESSGGGRPASAAGGGGRWYTGGRWVVASEHCGWVAAGAVRCRRVGSGGWAVAVVAMGGRW
jgi:hypothetical protein